jgi:serine/threonine-protein kinase
LTACLAKDREERPANAAIVADGLSLVLESRKELPVALRVFVKRGGRLGGTGGLIYVLMLPIAMGIAASLAPRGFEATIAWLTLGVGVLVGPAAILLARARGFLASGFDPQDLPAAFRIELEQGRDERVFEYGRTAGLYERVMRLLSAGSVAGVATAVWVASTAVYPYAQRAIGGVVYSAVAGLATNFLWLTRLNRRIDLDTRIWKWVWQGPMGRALFALARPFVNEKTLPSVGTHRATELALSLAAEQLFDSLPRVTRTALKDLPDVVEKLESDARRMRERLNLLSDALGPDSLPSGAGDELSTRRDQAADDLRRERDQVRARLKDAVAALETIRLNLLKLHAGTGSVESVTTDLGLAREVAADVDRLLEARKELDAES